MKKMKMSSEPRDRLSELPDSLIFNIFEFLPMKNVVSTQILSHRWKNLWTLTPYLNFDNDKTSNFEKFRNFVNRCLICWRGKKIQKFKVTSHTFDKSLFGDMDLWVRFAVDNGVEVLETFFPTICFKDRDDYCVPKCVYSCPSLRKLSFFGNTREISGKLLQWNQLKRLSIVCFSVTRHAIDQIMSGIPKLEVFILSFQVRDANLSLSFRSSSLKELSVRKRSFSKNILSPDRSFDCTQWNTQLIIWTPNLEILKIYGDIYGKGLVTNVPSKTHVTICFDSNVFLCTTLRRVLPSITHVEGLTLSDSGTKILGGLTVRSPPMPGVMFLNLNGSFERLQHMVRLLEIFPKLKTLVLHENNGPDNKMKFKPNPSKSFLVELRTVKVTWTMRDFSIFPLIKILFKYASKLEKIVFRVKRSVPASSASSNSMFLASQKLLKMPRSSPTAKLILCEY